MAAATLCTTYCWITVSWRSFEVLFERDDFLAFMVFVK